MQNCVQTKTFCGSWLVNDHIEACILKLQPPTEDEYSNDNTRSTNIGIVKLLLGSDCADGGKRKCEVSTSPSIVLAPELAFGSPDFNTLDSLIKKYEHNLIFICGFGFSDGATLIEISNKPGVEGIWKDVPQRGRKYNGGWVWVKNGNNVQSLE